MQHPDGFEFAITISFLIGYVTRPIALIGAILTFHLLATHGEGGEHFIKPLFLHLVFAWVGAGRCLGLDYYFSNVVVGFGGSQ